MQFKKFNGTTWDAIHHKTYDTLTESLTSFPAMIQASGEAMTDYTIYGNTGGVGDKTANLFDYHSGYSAIYPSADHMDIRASIGGSFSIIAEVEPNTEYTISYIVNATASSRKCRVGMTAVYPAVGGALLDVDDSFETVSGRVKNTFTTPANCRYIIVYFYQAANPVIANVEARMQSMMLAEGESWDFVPYGYQIPVSSGGVTTTLYTYTQLGLTDALTYTDTGIALPTFDGDNTITFGTTVQPSGMSATFKGWHAIPAPKTYDGNDWR